MLEIDGILPRFMAAYGAWMESWPPETT